MVSPYSNRNQGQGPLVSKHHPRQKESTQTYGPGKTKKQEPSAGPKKRRLRQLSITSLHSRTRLRGVARMPDCSPAPAPYSYPPPRRSASPSRSPRHKTDYVSTRGRIDLHKLRLYTRWVDYVVGGFPRVTNLYKDLRDGVVLCDVMHTLEPQVKFIGVNRKAVRKTAAMSNIEKALCVVWKKPVGVKNIPSAEEVYYGRSERCCTLVAEIFDHFILTDIWYFAGEIAHWYNTILEDYGRRVQFHHHVASTPPSDLTSMSSLHRSDYERSAGLRPQKLGSSCSDFGSGVSWACIIDAYAPNPVNFEEIYENPETPAQLASNIDLIFRAFASLDIPVFWTVQEFVEHPDEDFCLFQTAVVYQCLAALDRRPRRRRDAIRFKDSEQPIQSSAPAPRPKPVPRPAPASDSESEEAPRAVSTFGSSPSKRRPKLADLKKPSSDRNLSLLSPQTKESIEAKKPPPTETASVSVETSDLHVTEGTQMTPPGSEAEVGVSTEPDLFLSEELNTSSMIDESTQFQLKGQNESTQYSAFVDSPSQTGPSTSSISTQVYTVVDEDDPYAYVYERPPTPPVQQTQEPPASDPVATRQVLTSHADPQRSAPAAAVVTQLREELHAPPDAQRTEPDIDISVAHPLASSALQDPEEYADPSASRSASHGEYADPSASRSASRGKHADPSASRSASRGKHADPSASRSAGGQLSTEYYTADDDAYSYYSYYTEDSATASIEVTASPVPGANQLSASPTASASRSAITPEVSAQRPASQSASASEPRTATATTTQSYTYDAYGESDFYDDDGYPEDTRTSQSVEKPSGGKRRRRKAAAKKPERQLNENWGNWDALDPSQWPTPEELAELEARRLARGADRARQEGELPEAVISDDDSTEDLRYRSRVQHMPHATTDTDYEDEDPSSASRNHPRSRYAYYQASPARHGEQFAPTTEFTRGLVSDLQETMEGLESRKRRSETVDSEPQTRVDYTQWIAADPNVRFSDDPESDTLEVEPTARAAAPPPPPPAADLPPPPPRTAGDRLREELAASETAGKGKRRKKRSQTISSIMVSGRHRHGPHYDLQLSDSNARLAALADKHAVGMKSELKDSRVQSRSPSRNTSVRFQDPEGAGEASESLPPPPPPPAAEESSDLPPPPPPMSSSSTDTSKSNGKLDPSRFAFLQTAESVPPPIPTPRRRGTRKSTHRRSVIPPSATPSASESLPPPPTSTSSAGKVAGLGDKRIYPTGGGDIKLHLRRIKAIDFAELCRDRRRHLEHEIQSRKEHDKSLTEETRLDSPLKALTTPVKVTKSPALGVDPTVEDAPKVAPQELGKVNMENPQFGTHPLALGYSAIVVKDREEMWDEVRDQLPEPESQESIDHKKKVVSRMVRDRREDNVKRLAVQWARIKADVETTRLAAAKSKSEGGGTGPDEEVSRRLALQRYADQRQMELQREREVDERVALFEERLRLHDRESRHSNRRGATLMVPSFSESGELIRPGADDRASPSRQPPSGSPARDDGPASSGAPPPAPPPPAAGSDSPTGAGAPPPARAQPNEATSPPPPAPPVNHRRLAELQQEPHQRTSIRGDSGEIETLRSSTYLRDNPLPPPESAPPPPPPAGSSASEPKQAAEPSQGDEALAPPSRRRRASIAPSAQDEHTTARARANSRHAGTRARRMSLFRAKPGEEGDANAPPPAQAGPPAPQPGPAATSDANAGPNRAAQLEEFHRQSVAIGSSLDAGAHTKRAERFDKEAEKESDAARKRQEERKRRAMIKFMETPRVLRMRVGKGKPVEHTCSTRAMPGGAGHALQWAKPKKPDKPLGMIILSEVDHVSKTDPNGVILAAKHGSFPHSNFPKGIASFTLEAASMVEMEQLYNGFTTLINQDVSVAYV